MTDVKKKKKTNAVIPAATLSFIANVSERVERFKPLESGLEGKVKPNPDGFGGDGFKLTSKETSFVVSVIFTTTDGKSKESVIFYDVKEGAEDEIKAYIADGQEIPAKTVDNNGFTVIEFITE